MFVHPCYFAVVVVVVVVVMGVVLMCVPSLFAGLVLIIPCACLMELVARIKQGAGKDVWRGRHMSLTGDKDVGERRQQEWSATKLGTRTGKVDL